MEFYLTSRSLKNISIAGFDTNFEIAIFDETIKCSKFVASFLSPKISQLLQTDFTIDQFSINLPTDSVYYKSLDDLKTKLARTNFIHKLKLLLEGEPIDLGNNQKDKNQEISELLFEFGVFLDNQDMIEIAIQRLIGEPSFEEITIDNVKEILQMSRLLKNTEMKAKVLNFISLNFYCIFDKMKFEELREDELETILSSSELKIESEDWLFDTIISQSSDFYFLIDYINVEYLTNEKMQEMIDMINNDDVSLHRPLWNSICRRLVSEGMKPKFDENPRVHKNERNKQKKNNEIIECTGGIIEKLRSESNVNNNPYESKLIDVETTKINDGEIKNIFDKSKGTHLRLDSLHNGFILLDFKDKRINFSKYYFSVPDNGNYTGRPKSWIIEGSNDKQAWDNIDNKENDSSLNDNGRSNTFTCKNITNKFYRFIRIKEVVSHEGSSETHYFMISEVEFYGKIEKE